MSVTVAGTVICIVPLLVDRARVTKTIISLLSAPKYSFWGDLAQSGFTLEETATHLTHTRLAALCPGLPGWAGTRKAKPIWILLKQETVSGSCISWAICKSAPRSRQTTTPAPHHSVFYRPDALSAAQPTASKNWRQWKRLPIKQKLGALLFLTSVCFSGWEGASGRSRSRKRACWQWLSRLPATVSVHVLIAYRFCRALLHTQQRGEGCALSHFSQTANKTLCICPSNSRAETGIMHL